MARTYVVTGTASGIAAATAKMLKDQGNTVIGVDIHDADVVADLSTRQGRLDEANKAIELTGGKIDAVIACAGLAHPIAKTVSVNYFGMTEFLGAIARWVRRECIKPQWAGAGIPLNAIGPGLVRTPMTAEMIATAEARAAIDQQVPMPLNYYLEPENVAPLLIWLTSVENTHVTGQVIYIDGGSDAVLRGDNIWDLATT